LAQGPWQFLLTREADRPIIFWTVDAMGGGPSREECDHWRKKTALEEERFRAEQARAHELHEAGKKFWNNVQTQWIPGFCDFLMSNFKCAVALACLAWSASLLGKKYLAQKKLEHDKEMQQAKQ